MMLGMRDIGKKSGRKSAIQLVILGYIERFEVSGSIVFID